MGKRIRVPPASWPRTLRATLVSVAAVVGAAQAPAAIAATCQAKAPTVNLTVAIPAPTLDNTLAQPELQRMSDTMALERHDGRTLGLYWSKVTVPFTMNMRSVASGDTLCLSVVDVEVRVSMPERRIYVAKEWTPSTCPFASILGHEHKHQDVDDRIFDERAPMAQRRIADDIARIGAVGVARSQQESAQADIKTRVHDIVAKRIEEMIAARNQAQRDVDAGLEYSRVAASCREFRTPN